jgi:capsular exopolysaccharide synthesis family protein
MLLGGSSDSHLRLLVVTSAVSGEGKTSLSGHLAISLARAGFRTLLIDGDLRAPTAQRVFDLSLSPGLCEVLQGRAGSTTAARPSGVPGLSVMTAGEWTLATRQALAGDGWKVVKEQLKAEYDYIVVDTSPLLLVSDTLLLAREADGVVVSVLMGVSQVALVEEAMGRLHTVQAKVTGVIVNGARTAAHEYSHGYSPKDPIVPTSPVASTAAVETPTSEG